MYREVMNGVYNKYKVETGDFRGRGITIALIVLASITFVSFLGN